ncbi:MAG: SDR family NAD(P)-dependent oxidoreductase, partial [Nocardiopsaceae bacterium]|nr:SDR family NAD(P)-dependent oxidoreductase [Nocardiopsaceae bacterium]
MAEELDGRVVIVTGGGNGIGRAMSLEIARRGGKAVVADIDAAAASAVASEIKAASETKAAGGDAIAVTADVSDAASADRMVDEAVGHYGRVDGLVNNAAIYATVTVTRAPYDEITEREWDDMMRVNVKGTWLCSRAAARAMRAQGTGGAIVNVSSGTAFKGTPGLIHYVTSKAAILGFTRSLARELGPHHIKVNCIAPGATASTAPADDAPADGAPASTAPVGGAA